MRRLHVHVWRPRELHGPIALGYRGGNLGRRRYDCRCGADHWADDFERRSDPVEKAKGTTEVRGD